MAKETSTQLVNFRNGNGNGIDDGSRVLEDLKELVIEHVTQEEKITLATVFLETIFEQCDDDNFVQYFSPFLDLHPNVATHMLTDRAMMDVAVKSLITNAQRCNETLCTLDMAAATVSTK